MTPTVVPARTSRRPISNKQYVRCFEGNKRPEGEAMLQRLEERDLLPASDDDAIASRRVLSKDVIVGVHKKKKGLRNAPVQN